ncbi:MAG: dihydropteroate synthase [Desulforhopalus sp.]|nr:dihydropteroate synthase [Desulforhopalus sp.]
MFTVIGERINTTLKKVQAAVAEKNADYIVDDVRAQQAAGATYIDVNAGARIGHEDEDMCWLLKVIQRVTKLPLCLDSADPAILEKAFGLVEQTPMINSISLEKERFIPMMEFLKGKDCRIIALCMDDSGMPKTVDEIVQRAALLVKELECAGFIRDDIFIDPLMQPMSVDVKFGTMAMNAIQRIMGELEGVHTTGGLSNISYGLPQRRFINRTFLSMLITSGFDSAILDPLDQDVMATVKTAEMLVGNDKFCMNYIKGVRAEEIVA